MISFLILFPIRKFLSTTKQNSYYMLSLQIIEKNPLVIFLNIANIFMYSLKKRKDILSSLLFLSPWFIYALSLRNFHCTLI